MGSKLDDRSDAPSPGLLSMEDDSGDIAVYEVPADALRPVWISRAWLRFFEAQRRRPPRRIAPAVLCGVVSIVLHAVLIGTAVRGAGRAHTVRPPDAQGPGSSAIVSSQEPVMTLILINEPAATTQHESASEPLASLGFAPIETVTLLSPDIAPALDDNGQTDPSSANEAAPASDRARRALLFGRYVGQMQARIERAWLRPRSSIGANVFSCRVQVLQDRRGNVKQTVLQECNGTPAWQLSLVQAIQSASPLPAPPDPRVFADAVVLTFHARAYVNDGSAQGFEPQRMAAATAPLPMPASAVQSALPPLPADAP
jgi:hypothetical protein